MDNHSLRSPERRRPSRACSHRSTIWREDSVLCGLSSQSLRTPSRPSRRSSMSEVWARNEHHRLVTPYFDHRSDLIIKQPLHFESTLVLEG